LASKALLENLNAVIAGIGFLALEAGIVLRLGWAVALVVAGALLILGATVPYLRLRPRKGH